MTDNIESQAAEWSSNANEAVEISMISAGSTAPRELSSFHPRFTYPIFGDEETIFGFKDLRIEIRFAAHNLRPHAEISYSEKFKPIGDVKAPDIKAILSEFLPPEAFEDTETFNKQVQDEDAARFTPPGRLCHSYAKDGRAYEIWCGELGDTDVVKLLRRIQIVIAFFIEGGVLLDLEQEEWSLARWRVFFVYEKIPVQASPQASLYSLCGYSTSYRFITYCPTSNSLSTSSQFEIPPQTISVASLPNRSRISQFVILPPHQGQSHGRHLYNTMVDEFLADPACIEITVEDPSEEFDDLRDCCDFERFTKNGTFSQLHLNVDIDPKLAMKRSGIRVPTGKLIDQPLCDKLRVRNKCAPRQWKRLVDLYLLSQIPTHSRQGGLARLTQRAKAADPGDRALYYWRLLVKQRIYRQNLDVMAQFDLAERIEKLESTLEGQVDDYERLLRKVAESVGKEGVDGDSIGPSRHNKRRMMIDDDDSAAESEPKRTKGLDKMEVD